MAERRSSCRLEQQRSLRPRVYNKSYRETEVESSSSREMGNCTIRYNIVEKLKEERFMSENGMVKHFKDGREFSIKYIQTHEFNTPLLFHTSDGLNMIMPSKSFSILDIQRLIGGDRVIDVIDSSSQLSLNMTLRDFCHYYQNHEKGKSLDKRILNVISLEFSHTQLDPQVEPPLVVRRLDWVNKVWPESLKSKQKESTNDIKQMMYPKVQKYCLMSVAGSYTDFHLDFGGTSVWYHVLKGEKIFFVIPPTQENYSLFSDWQKHGKQEFVFFPDIVRECGIVKLREGNTLFLPSGWIHGVYTSKHSIVFGGNFLHSFHMKEQLLVYYMEKELKVQGKFCYPFYGQLHWYVINKYHNQLSKLGVSSESCDERDAPELSTTTGRWLVSVKLKKLPLSKFAKKLPHTRSHALQSPPFLSAKERDGLLLLIKKMGGDNLFLNDITSTLITSSPRDLLEKLYKQLNQVYNTCSKEPNGLTLLDDFLANDDNQSNESMEDVGVVSGFTSNEDQCLTFDEEFFNAADILSSCLDDTNIDSSYDKPVLRVNEDYTYGHFDTQPSISSPSCPDHAHYTAYAATPTTFDHASSGFKSLSLFPVVSAHVVATPPNLAMSEISSPLLGVTPSVANVKPHPPITPPVLSEPELKSPSIAGDSDVITMIQTANIKTTKKRRKSSKDSKPLRKVRCGQCLECLQEPCGVCKFCLDSPKYGGIGKLRKACLHRRCSNMQFSKTSTTVTSPVATTPLATTSTISANTAHIVTSFCEQLPTDSTTTEYTNSTIISKSVEETTVVAMGYAVGSDSNDMIEEDIDLTELLETTDSSIFTDVSAQQLSNTCDPMLSPLIYPSQPLFLASPTFSSPMTTPYTSPPLVHHSHSSSIDNEFHLHLSDDDIKR